MRFIDHCTITGADNWVAYDDINAVSREYPFAEWAMLLSNDEYSLAPRNARRRFPTESWMMGFIENCPDVRKTVHLCGPVLRDFIDGQKKLESLLAKVDGVQLNFKFREGGKFLLQDPHALEQLVKRVERFAPTEVILQYGDPYIGLADAFRELPHVTILIDGSAGSGQLPDEWPRPHPDFLTSYAGGLHPTIVVQEIEKIRRMLPSGYVVPRIDAETGYRNKLDDEAGNVLKDEFSVPKVFKMCEAAKPYIRGVDQRPAPASDFQSGKFTLT